MNLGTSYIVWDYSSSVPYMWFQTTFVATLDPMATLGRLPVFEQCCWTVLSWLPAIAKGLFSIWELHTMVCADFPVLPSPPPLPFPCCWVPVFLQKLEVQHRVGRPGPWSTVPMVGDPPAAAVAEVQVPRTPLEQQNKDQGNDLLQWAVIADVKFGKMIKFAM